MAATHLIDPTGNNQQRYTNPLFNVNQTANLDWTYGPYVVDHNPPLVTDLPANTQQTIYPGKTFGFVYNGKNIEYWAQLKQSVIDDPSFDFNEAVKTVSNYELVIKQSGSPLQWIEIEDSSDDGGVSVTA